MIMYWRTVIFYQIFVILFSTSYTFSDVIFRPVYDRAPGIFTAQKSQSALGYQQVLNREGFHLKTKQKRTMLNDIKPTGLKKLIKRLINLSTASTEIEIAHEPVGAGRTVAETSRASTSRLPTPGEEFKPEEVEGSAKAQRFIPNWEDAIKPAYIDQRNWKKVLQFTQDIRSMTSNLVRTTAVDLADTRTTAIDEWKVLELTEAVKTDAGDFLNKETALFSMLQKPYPDISKLNFQIESTHQAREKYLKTLERYVGHGGQDKNLLEHEEFKSSANNLARIKKGVLISLLKDEDKAKLKMEDIRTRTNDAKKKRNWLNIIRDPFKSLLRAIKNRTRRRNTKL